MIVCFATVAIMPSRAFSLALDSVSTWGRFPRFCVNVYRWGDKFFNSYDSAYVVGPGTKFNVKIRTESWIDFYNFDLPDDYRMQMLSDPCTSTGVWLTYLALSVGYDMNVSKFFGGSENARRRFTFGFSCSLFAADLYFISNDVGTRITRFGNKEDMLHPDLDFNGINTSSWGVETYYFFNHKKYSQAAALKFSKIQKRSQGSFYAGLSYWSQKFQFDFGALPEEMKAAIPEEWGDRYNANNQNYAFKVGYGYNWVFSPKWLLGVSEAPTLGLKKGYINNIDSENYSFALYNRASISVVWNHKRWFAGMVGTCDVGLIYDKNHTFSNAVISGEISVGYRFNIW